jgi:DNA-binding winged helix-turn-helix (wHTH) protein
MPEDGSGIARMNSSRLKPRFHFAGFVVSPTRRLLLRRGEPIRLIPRYFDLLLLLLERRNEALHRRDILDTVWSDVVVSDGALSQAIRVLRRVLGDDPRKPVYIHTVSRHGYRFIYGDVTEEADETALPAVDVPPAAEPTARQSRDDRVNAAVACLLAPDGDENEQREAAEALHALGTEEALWRIRDRPGRARARALLRDTRWTVPGAGPVPMMGQPGSVAAAFHLAMMRARRAVRLAGSRWAAAVFGGALSGLVAGAIGGVVLFLGPGSFAVESVMVGLPVIGMTVGALGAFGVGGGLAGAEAVLRSWRGPALVLCGAAGGGLIGALAHGFGLVALQTVFGGDLSPLAGGFEGLVLGGAVGLGYALATPTTEGGMATPRGKARILTACSAGGACAAAAVGLARTGSYLGAMSLEFMARRFPGSDVGLAPLSRLLGEGEPGWITNLVISGWEGFMFGFGVILGLTRRPRRP